MARAYSDVKPDLDEERRRQSVWDALGKRGKVYSVEDFLTGNELFNSGFLQVEEPRANPMIEWPETRE